MTSCGHLEELFEFLEGFRNFIECAFFGGPWTVNVKAPLVATSLTDTLSELGITKVISDFTD
ncbi:MAG: hypothetical protein Q8T09_08830 [Candidatus Melainabacteria bacterium]|nr:hypothetical protein [Candidatus Melainabacteria bacterium]